MAANFAVDLSQDGFPGAFLKERHPTELNNDALRFWLKCRGDKGLKTITTELILPGLQTSLYQLILDLTKRSIPQTFEQNLQLRWIERCLQSLVLVNSAQVHL